MLMIQMVLVKKHKQKGDFSEVECEDDSEELESGCETYKKVDVIERNTQF